MFKLKQILLRLLQDTLEMYLNCTWDCIWKFYWLGAVSKALAVILKVLRFYVCFAFIRPKFILYNRNNNVENLFFRKKVWLVSLEPARSSDSIGGIIMTIGKSYDKFRLTNARVEASVDKPPFRSELRFFHFYSQVL